MLNLYWVAHATMMVVMGFTDALVRLETIKGVSPELYSLSNICSTGIMTVISEVIRRNPEVLQFLWSKRKTALILDMAGYAVIVLASTWSLEVRFFLLNTLSVLTMAMLSNLWEMYKEKKGGGAELENTNTLVNTAGFLAGSVLYVCLQWLDLVTMGLTMALGLQLLVVAGDASTFYWLVRKLN